MAKILGLDLGTNSIGWALVDNYINRILGMGTIIFPMGINLEKGTKEVSKNFTRREKRQIRRQFFRRGMRKELLVKELIKHDLFPDIDSIYERAIGSSSKATSFRRKWQAIIQMKELPDELKSFFSIDPYHARHRGFEGDKLGKYELGRIFYHLAQRRGYKESLQQEEDGKIFEGNPEEGKTGITETKGMIMEYGSLGNYLYHQNPHQKRLRNRYTLRSMYETEFDAIWEKQQNYYPELLTNDLYQRLGGRHRTDSSKNGVLFYQRPLRSQKHLLRNCRYETGKPVCPSSAMDFELYRAWQVINNIKESGRQLNENDRQKALQVFLDKEKVRFEDVRKKLTYPKGQYNYDDKDSFAGCKTIYNFQKILRKKWDELSNQHKEDLWHLKYWADDPEWLHKKLAQPPYQLDDDEFNKLKKLKLDDKYANLSRTAIRNILHFLEKGYIYDEAVLLAGVRKAFGKPQYDKLPNEEHDFVEDNVIGIAKQTGSGTSIDRIRSFLKERYRLSDKQLTKLYHHSIEQRADQIEKYLKLPDDIKNPVVMQSLYELRKLYNAIVDEYGQPDEIRVETARDLKASKQKRADIRQQQRDRETHNDKLKAILDEHNIKHTRDNLRKIYLYKEIEAKYGKCVNPFNSEQTFSLNDLFKEGYLQVEHIIPYSISLNDSLDNVTLCDADTNGAKGERTPYNYFMSMGDNWENIKSQIFHILPYNKARRFISEVNPDADSFIQNQLNDTRYISKIAREYLKNVCKNVDIIQGAVTSLLRHHWGLDTILNNTYVLDVTDDEYFVAVSEGNICDYAKWNYKSKNKDQERLEKLGELMHGRVQDGIFYPFKERTDHRHHAIDALVVALSKRKHLQQASTAHALGKTNRDMRKEHIVERPWLNFWQEANNAVENILVYHKPRRRILSTVRKKLFDNNGSPKKDKKNGKQLYGQGMAARGPLHEETVYGKYTDDNGNEVYHVRKPIDFIQNHKHLAKVVDPGIRIAIEERLENCGIDTSGNWKIADIEDKELQKQVFFKTNEKKERVPQVFLPNKNGNPVPIKKVRIAINYSALPQLKNNINQYVVPGNNHHLMVYKPINSEIQYKLVSFWEAIERIKQKQLIYQLPAGIEGPILNVFQINDLYLLGLSDAEFAENENNNYYLSKFLYRVRWTTETGYKIAFVKHIATNYDNPNNLVGISSMASYEKMNPIKVNVSRLGKIIKIN